MQWLNAVIVLRLLSQSKALDEPFTMGRMSDYGALVVTRSWPDIQQFASKPCTLVSPNLVSWSIASVKAKPSFKEWGCLAVSRKGKPKKSTIWTNWCYSIHTSNIKGSGSLAWNVAKQHAERWNCHNVPSVSASRPLQICWQEVCSQLHWKETLIESYISGD